METISEFSRELNNVLRFLVQSNMELISVLVAQSEFDCWSAGANTSRTLEVGFLKPDNNRILNHIITCTDVIKEDTILDKINGLFGPLLPPHYNDAKMAQLALRAPSSLLWVGGGGWG